ncbi:MAG: preprotein translocase subunit SecG [Alphaproteobacteria bacterium]|nr:preprotein translocase subunit SecG [Alphaproteobacteria bacterium]OJV46623.1 MAG: preprotein translocase subunit SecG [Alphaproteobacteria bacterium 43-37]
MLTFLLVVHVLVTLGMVASILLQRSEGGGFVSSASSFMTARGSANFLTRLTAIFAAAFIVLSLILAIIAGGYKKNRSILDDGKDVKAIESSVPTPAGEPAIAPGEKQRDASAPSTAADVKSSSNQNENNHKPSNP